MEDDLQGRTTFGGRQPVVEDDLQWTITFSGRRPSVEVNLWWKTTFGGGRPSVEDNLPWKTFFGRKWPSVENVLRGKMTFGLRWPLLEDDLGGRWPAICAKHVAVWVTGQVQFSQADIINGNNRKVMIGEMHLMRKCFQPWRYWAERSRGPSRPQTMTVQTPSEQSSRSNFSNWGF